MNPMDSPEVTLPVAKFTPSDAHCHLLGKRHTLLNHDSFHSLSKSVDENTTSFKRQKMATHINTRHMAVHFTPSSHKKDVLEVQSPTSPSFSPKESSGESSTQRQQLLTSNTIDGMEDTSMIEEDVFMDGIDTHSSNSFTSDQTNADISSPDTRVSPGSIVLVQTSSDKMVLDEDHIPKKVQSTSSRQESQSHTPSQVVEGVASDILSNHDDDIVAMVQVTGFFNIVQDWANTVQKICDAREKQLLHHELFGEKLTFGANAPDLVRLLEVIDQQKNQVTYQEANFTSLVEKIDKVLKTCKSIRDWQIIGLATRILDNFYQRFENRRFP